MMKHILLVMLLILASLTGCRESPEAREKRKELEAKARETGAAIGEYTQAMKEEFLKKSQDDLETLDRKLDEYRAKAKEATDDAKIQMEAKLKELEVHREKAQQQLQKLTSDSKDAWAELQSGFESAFGDLQKAFDKAGESFK